MSNYYVDLLSGNDTTGDGSHATPWKSLKKATDTVTAGNHNIWIFNTAADAITVDTTYTIAEGIQITGTSDTTNDPPTSIHALGTYTVINGDSTGVDIVVNGGPAKLCGLHIKAQSSLKFASADLSLIEHINCLHERTGTSSGQITYGPGGSSGNTKNILQHVSTKFGAASQSVTIGAPVEIIGGSWPVSGGTTPTTLIKFGDRQSLNAIFNGTDFSNNASNTIFADSTLNPALTTLIGCKLSTTATLNAALGVSGLEILLHDCSSGDVHYNFAHYAYAGSTTISTVHYAPNGASYDGTNKHAWVVAGNANTTPACPYRTPWLSRYHAGTAEITPYLEILRDGSTTAYTDIQVAAEFAAKVTSGFPLLSHYTDYAGPASTGANQASGMGITSWTELAGDPYEGGDTAWSGKLDTGAAITPAEIGHIMARVVVFDNITVYADPTIRGTT
jgi:hypothetical protein